jgi:hypothetical protein
VELGFELRASFDNLSHFPLLGNNNLIIYQRWIIFVKLIEVVFLLKLEMSMETPN